MKFCKVPWFEGPAGNERYRSFVSAAEKAIRKLRKSSGAHDLSMGSTDIARELTAFMTGLGQALGLPGVPKMSVRCRYQEPRHYSELHRDAKHLDRTDPNSGTYWDRMCARLVLSFDTQLDRQSPSYLLLEFKGPDHKGPRLYVIEFNLGFWVSEDQGEGRRTGKADLLEWVVIRLCMKWHFSTCCGFLTPTYSATWVDRIPWHA